jgi:hypothetical protein
MGKIVHKLSQLTDATYLDKTGFHSGRSARLLLESQGMNFDENSQDDRDRFDEIVRNELDDEIASLDQMGALRWSETPQTRQEVFIDAWIRGFNKLSR